MKHRRSSRSGQNLVEVLVAIVFLAAGGMAVYTASQRSVAEAAWGAEHVMAEGLVNDLVEFCRTYKFDGLQSMGFPATRAAVNAASLKAVVDLPPMGEKTLLSDPADPNADNLVKTDPIVKEFRDTVQVLNLKRIILFTPAADGKSAVVSCIVEWKSRANPDGTAIRKFTIFHEP